MTLANLLAIQRLLAFSATPEGVTDDLIANIFAALPAAEDWKPL